MVRIEKKILYYHHAALEFIYSSIDSDCLTLLVITYVFALTHIVDNFESEVQPFLHLSVVSLLNLNEN